MVRSVVRCLLLNILLVQSRTDDFDYALDFVHSFLVKADKLGKTKRLDSAEERWIKKTGYKDAVGISVDNWTNQKLEYPEVTISEGSKDRWYKPVDIEKHTRDIAMLAYGVEGLGTTGSLSYLVEDSWPKNYICLGWKTSPTGVDVVISVADKHLDYDGLLGRELSSLILKNHMRYYKATQEYVVAITCQEEGPGLHLVVSVVPQHLDVWAWEKHYKHHPQSHQVSVQRVELEILPTKSLPAEPPLREETDSGPGIFQHKKLLIQGESVRTWQGNKTELQLLAETAGSAACGLRIENWSRHSLGNPEIKFKFGKESKHLPVKSVTPGFVELVILEQEEKATGVSAVIRWNVGTTSKVLSLMISVPYNQHLWSSWVAAGLTRTDSVPDFNAMYSGTPDSTWFLRQKMGRRIEFANSELILVIESDVGLNKPLVRLSVVPLNPTAIAKSIQHRFESLPSDGLKEDRSVLALSSGYSASSHCQHQCSQVILFLAILGIRIFGESKALI